MKKKIELFKPLIYTSSLALIAITVFVGFFDHILFSYVLPFTTIILVFVAYKTFNFKKDVEKFLKSMGCEVAGMYDNTLTDFPMPVIFCSNEGEIIWNNNSFTSEFKYDNGIFGKNVWELFPKLAIAELSDKKTISIEHEEKLYTVYVVKNFEEANSSYSLYFIEDTKLKKTTAKYHATRSTVMLVVIDNYEELIQSAKENERSQIIGEVEYEIDRFAKQYDGIVCKTERDRFSIILQSKAMSSIIESKFTILDTVRHLNAGDKMPATLSIGIGRDDDDLRNLEQSARQALDMALGRGGDQAALRTPNGYDFYGGVSKGVEKRTKVKTRIVATALAELIESCGNIIIMGHRFPDLDAFGAAVGLSKCIVQMDKKVNIAIRKNKHLVSPLYEKLEENGYAEIFASPEALIDTVTNSTLLIIVDTHIETFLESAELYRACKNVVVIDHHRKMVGHIDNAVIFYHEPYASSASEMVSELLPYISKTNQNISRIEADALLAGIMLDTKNFVIKTGVRTFEAAAFLKKQGADTVEVRKLFSSSIETYQRRSRLVAGAEVYRGCAIASANVSDDIKIVAPQAADELLNISDVDASFVMYEEEGQIAFSARSMGKINVQIIMESLGGGGHLTMAGAQIKNMDMENARQALLESIDKYYDSLAK